MQFMVLSLAILASIVLFGWQKPRNDNKLVTIFIILVAAVFQIATFLLLGLKLGFVRNIYSWNLASVVMVFLPALLLVISTEILRGQLIEDGKRSLSAIITTGASICLIQCIISLPLYNLAVAESAFIYSFTLVGPSILTNILLTYIAYTYDYHINIYYQLIMTLPAYLLPITPNTSAYLPAIFQIALLFLIAVWLIGQHQNKRALMAETKRKSRRTLTDTQKQARQIVKWSLVSVSVIIMVTYIALMSGLLNIVFWLLVAVVWNQVFIEAIW